MQCVAVNPGNNEKRVMDSEQRTGSNEQVS